MEASIIAQCRAFPATVLLVAPPGFRRKLDLARLAALGIQAQPLDSAAAFEAQAPSADGLALVDGVLVDEVGASLFSATWIEIIADDGDQGRHGVRAVARESAGDMFVRLAAPHDSIDHALDPSIWGELALLAKRAPRRVRGIVDGYLEGVEARMEQLSEALREGVLASASRTAHAWKGASGSIGADRLSDALGRIDHAAQAGDLGPCATLMAVVKLRSEAAAFALRQRITTIETDLQEESPGDENHDQAE